MLHLAVIGTNWITSSFVASAHATSQYTLCAVYSRTLATAQAFASKHASLFPSQQINTHTSLESLAQDASLDTVYIASPNTLHHAQAKAMLQAGKHVILEKPLCPTLAEAEDLFSVAKAHGVFLFEAWRHVHEGNFGVLRRAVEDRGLLGDVYGASITYAQFSSRYDKVLDAGAEVPNIFSLEYGGGALADLGCYTVAAAVWLFGAPDESEYHPLILERTGVDGAGTMLLRYHASAERNRRRPFLVHLHYSKIANSTAPTEIYGERGTLSVPSVTDIERVTFVDARTKERRELGGKKVDKELNLKDEAEEYARIVREKDWGAAEVLRDLSREVVRVTEKARAVLGEGR